jgi:hypothetical protein
MKKEMQGVSYLQRALKGMMSRPEGLSFKAYCKAAGMCGMTPMSADEFKAMPVGGGDLEKLLAAMHKAEEEGDSPVPGGVNVHIDTASHNEGEGEEDEGEGEGEDEGGASPLAMARKAARKAAAQKGMFDGQMAAPSSAPPGKGPKLKSVSKADEDEADTDAEEDEGDDDEMAMARKSVVSASDLLKSIRAYDAISDALAETTNPREAYLTGRLDAGLITKSERAELGRLWSGAANESRPQALHKSLSAAMDEDDGVGPLVDASDFLKSLVSGVDHRLNAVSDEVGRQGRATRELLKAQGTLVKGLAGIVAEQDQIIKALGERLGTVERAPAPRRAVTATPASVTSRPLAKSVTGGAGPDILSKSQITQGLRTLMLHAVNESDDAAQDRIMHATALYEQTGAVPPNILAAIRAV